MTAADLTRIEIEILRGLLTGKTCKQIAAARGRSIKTVESQLQTLRLRLGVNNLAQLGAWAERHGIREAGAQL